MSWDEEYWREGVGQRARRARPIGERDETRFPVRPAGVTDIDPRATGKVVDQSNDQIFGFFTWDPDQEWGG